MQPSKESLTNHVDELSRELVTLNRLLHDEQQARIRAEQALYESEDKFRGVLENSYDIIYRFNLVNDRFDYLSPSLTRLLGYTPDEIRTFTFDTIMTFIHPADRPVLQQGFTDMYSHPHPPDETPPTIEFRLKRKGRTANYVWVSDTRSVVLSDTGELVAIVGTLRDISERKQAEAELQQIRDNLEALVRERTASLQEANSALRILLQQREQDLKEIEEKIQLNVKQMVTPFIDRLKRSDLDRDQQTSLELMESSLHEILTPFIRSLSTRYLTLTFTEIQVANLIRAGKTSKEIADSLHMSERTIEAHRYHIRKKLGLRNKSANLTLKRVRITPTHTDAVITPH